MKAILAALVLLIGCAPAGKPVQPMAATPALQPQEVDHFEVLAWHLQKRIEELGKLVGKLEHQLVERENLCLDSEIAVLEGRRSKKRPPLESLASSLGRSMDRMIQDLLDAEDAIEEHNRKHPQAPMAQVRDLLTSLCGRCEPYRTMRQKSFEARRDDLNREIRRAMRNQ